VTHKYFVQLNSSSSTNINSSTCSSSWLLLLQVCQQVLEHIYIYLYMHIFSNCFLKNICISMYVSSSRCSSRCSSIFFIHLCIFVQVYICFFSKKSCFSFFKDTHTHIYTYSGAPAFLSKPQC
jgi:hypothetical protein